jgi:hypothetical protein
LKEKSAKLPTHNPLGGPKGKGHVTFDSSQSQFLDAGPRTLNIATNGGLTIVAVVRFTGTIGNCERIIDLGSGAQRNNLLLAREGSSTNLVLHIYNGTSLIVDQTCDVEIQQDTWLTVLVRYDASTSKCWLTVNNATCSPQTASEAVTDRTLSGTYMGKSHG